MKDVEKKEGFTTTANACNYLYHPIAIRRDELIQIYFAFKIHRSTENFCVKTLIFAAKILFLLDFSKFRLHLLNDFNGSAPNKQKKAEKQAVNC